MKRAVAVLAATMCLIVPAVAFGYAQMHGRAKVALVQAIFHGTPGLTHQRALDCFAATRSTVNRSWADTYFSGFTHRRTRECSKLGSNGVAFVHYTRGRWRSVIAGSDFPTCRLRGVPRAVVRDLARSLPRGFLPRC